jgi:hypothetical protein
MANYYMSFKFYKPSEYIDSPNLSLLDILDDKVIFVENIPSLIDNKKMNADLTDAFYNKTKPYECIVIYQYEHIYVDAFMDILERYYIDKKIVIFNTFTSGIKHYFDIKFPNNKFYVKSVIDNIKAHMHPLVHLQESINQRDFKINTTDKRKYLLKAFSFNRSPHRDYVMDVLLKRNLVVGNNISFHNYPFDVENEKITYDKLKNRNNAYNTKEAFKLYNTLDYNLLNSIKIVPESENFDIMNQPEHTKRNSLASVNSYFEILSEAQMPMSDDIESMHHYSYCITKRTVTPMYYGNIFHIMPFSKLMVDDFNKSDLCTFFNSDEEFFNNLHEDFFFKKESIEKLNHNHNRIKEYYIEYIGKNGNHKPFVISKIEELFSVELTIFK